MRGNEAPQVNLFSYVHLAPRPPRHVTGCALLRLRDGSVWLLRSPGHAWTAERLRGAGQLLSQLREAELASRP